MQVSPPKHGSCGFSFAFFSSFASRADLGPALLISMPLGSRVQVIMPVPTDLDAADFAAVFFVLAIELSFAAAIVELTRLAARAENSPAVLVIVKPGTKESAKESLVRAQRLNHIHARGTDRRPRGRHYGRREQYTRRSGDHPRARQMHAFEIVAGQTLQRESPCQTRADSQRRHD